jgi:hypothetical protein
MLRHATHREQLGQRVDHGFGVVPSPCDTLGKIAWRTIRSGADAK